MEETHLFEPEILFFNGNKGEKMEGLWKETNYMLSYPLLGAYLYIRVVEFLTGRYRINRFYHQNECNMYKGCFCTL